MSNLPIKFNELLQLQQNGISQDSIGFVKCTLQSDRFVCVRQENATGAAEVKIINLKDNASSITRSIKADNAIMHWTQNIIALRAQGRTLQIFDLTSKSKLKSTTMNEDVVFWTFYSENCLGIVTDTSVYHWDILDAAQATPEKVFDRNANLSDCQIINYRVSPDGGWMVLVGISQQQGRVVGNMQLYSKERGISQSIEGHAAAFGNLRLEGASADSKLFTFVNRMASGAKLHIVEVDHQANQPVFTKKNVDVYFPAEASNDFPVAMQVSDKYKVIYVVTKYGFIHLYDLETGQCIFMNRISSETIFVTCPDEASTGLVGINRKGQVLSVTVDEATIIPYLLQNPENTELAYKLASRGGLPGAERLYQARFDQMWNSGQYQQAAEIAGKSPQGSLRSMSTIERLKSIPTPQGQKSLLLVYLGKILEAASSSSRLADYESLELGKLVLQSPEKGKPLLERFIDEQKLTCTEQLGDLTRIHDLGLALQIFRQANVPQKVIAAMAETGNFEQILPYAKEAGYTPDFNTLLQHIVHVNPERGAEFASSIAKEDPSLIDTGRVFDIFSSQNMVQQATAFGLDVLGTNRPEDGALQTRLIELNLMNAPQVADAILGNDMFSHFDKPRIAQMCEQAGLMSRALELHEDPAAIKRIIVQTDKIPEDFLIPYFGRLTVELALDCLNEMLSSNIRQNLQAVINIAKQYSELFEAHRIIALLEKYRTAEGLYYFLGGIVNMSDDQDIVFKYIEAATTMGQMQEVERMCRERVSQAGVTRVKNFLMEQKLTEQLPLIIVCDRFNLVHDLVLYLYKNQQFKSIEVYVQRVNPARVAGVVGGLLDLDCEESTIKNLLGSVPASSVPIDELVKEVETRNRLKLLLPFLEAALQQGIQQTAIYDALAKIKIDSNDDAERWLVSNDQYDTLSVGKYCEKRDPNLAFIAYEKGQNDLELINITNENSMFRQQARYLLDRADSEIWAYVLSENNMHRRSLIEQVISTAVPNCTDPEKVSTAVKAFLDADMPDALIELLEKVILEPSTFSDNANLQNLLMLTACKSDRGRLAGYIQNLDAYSADDIAQQCIEVGLFDEAHAIYKKDNNHVASVNVLVEHIVSIDRAQTYAEQVDQPEVWSVVAKAQLDGLRVTDAIDSYMHASDPSNYNEVIEIATRAGKDEDLIKYLRMARKTLREPAIDTGLAFCYARTNQLSELQDFLRNSVTNAEASGDKAYEEGFHEAAKIFYTSISHYAKLATTLVYLEDFQGAVECARKANNVKVWRQVNEVCIAKKEFRLAQICGLNLIVHADELADLVQQYEHNGYFDELIALLEAGLGLERAHMGIFTSLGVALSRYHPERTMEHLRIFWQRTNLPKMMRACEEAHLWPELVFLYRNYEEYDNAALAMMERAADAWEHQSFKETIIKVANTELFYKSLTFYQTEQPSLITDLLQALTSRIDVSRVVRLFKKSDNIPMIKPFLLNVQSQNKREVNDAINDLLIEEVDYKTLRDSVENYDNYDALALAQRLEKDDLIFFRQIAASIYRKSKRWDKSIGLSKQDKLFKDAIATAATSGRQETVEELLRYFVDIGSRECYVGMLYACYELISVPTIMELSWRHGLNDFTMPFMINYMAQQTQTIASLKKDNDERKAREREQQRTEDDTPILGGSRLMLTQGPQATTPAPYLQTNGTGHNGFR